MRKIILIFILFFFSTFSFAMAEDLTQEKDADIKKLLEITGSLKLSKQMSVTVIKNVTQILKSTRPDIPEKMYKILEEEVNLIIDEQIYVEGGFLEMVTIIYHKHFTHEDVKGLIAFYRTELGKKLIKILPQVLQESMQAGQIWGQALGPLIQERFKKRFEKEGIDLSA